MDITEVQRIDMTLRKCVQSLCAPIWWESAQQAVVRSGTMCVVQTPEALVGITNNHVLEIYERHKAEKHDIFCQLGSAPFDPTDNLISRSQHWDLATFTIPRHTLEHFEHEVSAVSHWPPKALEKEDCVVFGGYLEARRSVPPGPHPPTMSPDFVSFRLRPHNCSPEKISFQVDLSQLTWLPKRHQWWAVRSDNSRRRSYRVRRHYLRRRLQPRDHLRQAGPPYFSQGPDCTHSVLRDAPPGGAWPELNYSTAPGLLILHPSTLALAETEIIRPRGPWRNLDQVEYATLKWVDWFNNRQLLGPIGDIPPVELEQLHYHEQEVWPMMAGPN